MLKFKEVEKTYYVGEQKVEALKKVSFEIKKGQLTVILGPSGSGKSTLLNLLGGMDRVTSGKILLDGEDITDYNDKALSNYRKDQVGFVFQFYNLIPNLTALENVGIAAQLTGKSNHSLNFIERVGLGERKNNFPSQLSGGEMQRVAIARALAKEPSLLLCDEPTGALDSETGKSILELIRHSASDKQTAVVLVTHNAEVAHIADKVIRLHDGEIESITENETPLTVKEVSW
ncbi:Macrolide export ATP-binding/permease protein MacB [Listeria fleischmannii subsp. fleischmannii]|uniref:Macrolide export ATP-binding/permease protein MacB n=1 Tax=Listeria fleischmannii subsp. fleischmannii TaxID=1671902 RepID=A0A2X3GUS6_9LIST|nr:ABC transporter ATP-binding protein [Listeria fleischmannii subsp. fleischmannii LU2006-1]SQC72012.1 Macrolide export ATP-binding/permease protein MacB [Listeria fleischmannii subsp. fleischmannii]